MPSQTPHREPPAWPLGLLIALGYCALVAVGIALLSKFEFLVNVLGAAFWLVPPLVFGLGQLLKSQGEVRIGRAMMIGTLIYAALVPIGMVGACVLFWPR